MKMPSLTWKSHKKLLIFVLAKDFLGAVSLNKLIILSNNNKDFIVSITSSSGESPMLIGDT